MKGLYNKYIISKSDGSPVNPNADYFILRLDNDPDARGAARNYAQRIQSKNPKLSEELRQKCDEYWQQTLESQD